MRRTKKTASKKSLRINAASASPPTEARDTPPWEEIETGRYQPRRIRGSCRGRELG